MYLLEASKSTSDNCLNDWRNVMPATEMTMVDVKHVAVISRLRHHGPNRNALSTNGESMDSDQSATNPTDQTASKPLTRAERRAQRIAKREARQKRIEARQKRIDARAKEAVELGGIMPMRVILAPSVDNLATFDRFGQQMLTSPLRDIWRGSAGFLVCSGPSLRNVDVSLLRQRGVVSLGINNAAAFAHTRAFTCSDPPYKFHHGIWLDPTVMKLVPVPKLKERIRAKLPDGTFKWTQYTVADCPNVYAYDRSVEWHSEDFFTSTAATWGANQKFAEANNVPKQLFTFYLGLRLMHYLGVRRVYLLGVDFHMTPENKYAWPDSRQRGVVGGNNNQYRNAIIRLKQLEPVFARHNFRLYNCNPDSALTLFPYVPYDEALADCRSVMPDEPFDCDGYYAKPLSDGNPADCSDQAD